MSSLLLASLLLTSPVAEAGVRNPDLKTGWKELKWGTAPPAGASCKPDGARKYCTRSGDEDKKVGEVAVTSVTYVYWNDRLLAVKLMTDQEQAAFVTYRALETSYGKGETDGVDAPTRWNGDRIAIRFEFAPNFKGATLTYTYLPLYGEMMKKATEGADDLVPKAADDL